jgi:hypothetical protein
MNDIGIIILVTLIIAFCLGLILYGIYHEA